MSDNLKIASLNVRGIADFCKRRKVLKLLEENKSDIFLLQETHINKCTEWNGNCFFNFLNSSTAGVAIFVKSSFQGVIERFHSNHDGRICFLDMKFNGIEIRVVCVYAPNHPPDRKLFFSQTLPSFLSLSRVNVLAGDMNCVKSLSKDTHDHSLSRSTSQIGSAELEQVVSGFCLSDAYKSNPGSTKNDFTWYSPSSSTASRLDRFYVPVSSLSSVDSDFFPYTDHKIVHCSLELTDKGVNPGKSYWKLNNSVLHDDKYLKLIKDLIADSKTLRLAFDKASDWWDDLKERIKKVTIKHCAIKKRESEQVEYEIKTRLKYETDPEEVVGLKNELERLTDQKLDALFVRSRLQEELHDEKCSALFFQRIKERQVKKDIKKIIDVDSGLGYTNNTDIINVFEDYYKNLYAFNPGDDVVYQQILCSVDAPSEEDSGFTIKKDILKMVISGMKNNKTPGMDGLTTEFYKTFFGDLYDILTEVYVEIHTHNTVPKSMTKAVTVLLPKKPNSETPSDYRPITLLNIDYKILTKYINQVYFPEFLKTNISPEQLCAVPGRNIHNGTIFIRDVIEYCRDKEKSGILMSLDQRKAFDLVDRKFMFQVLEKKKFNNDVLAVIKTLYHQTSTSVQVNGHLSGDIELQRGVRQGCPLSPSLYVIYVESFLSYIRNQSGFIGIQLPHMVAKVSAYADDLLFFCRDQKDINCIFAFFQNIKKGTGSELNLNKTQLLAIGKSALVTSDYLVESIKVCGVIFKNAQSHEAIKENTLMCIEKMKKQIDFFKTVPCTIKGKVLIANTILFPKIFFIAKTFLPGKVLLALVKRLVYSFLYGDGKSEMFKRECIELDKDKGGLGLYNLDTFCEAIFVQENVCIPSHEDFDHQRKDLFQYLFSFWLRNFYPDFFERGKPHCFSLLDPYRQAKDILFRLEDKKDILNISRVSNNQLYQWLSGDKEIINFKIPREADMSDDVKNRLIKIWNDYKVSVKNSSFVWKVAMKGLKTGEFLKKIKMQRVGFSCVFCKENSVETIEHIFAECKSLGKARDLILQFVKRLGVRVPEDRYQGQVFFCLGLTSDDESKEINRLIFECVAECNSMIWLSRNSIVFEHQHSGDKLIEVEKKVDYICERTYKEKFLKVETQSTDNLKSKGQARLKGE